MPRLTIESGPYAGESFVFEGEAIIGRLESNVVPIPDDDEASRKHAAVRLDAGRFVVMDLKSKNGTRLNGRRITKSELAAGDRITVGSSVILFIDGETEATLETAESEPVSRKSESADAPTPDPKDRDRDKDARRPPESSRADRRANRRVLEVVLFTLLLALTFANASYLTQILLRLIDG